MSSTSSSDPNRVIASLARDQVNLDLKTVDLCFLASLYLRADKMALASFEEDVLIDMFEQVCDVVEPGAENPRKRATHVENLGAFCDLPAVDGWLVAHVAGWDTATVQRLLPSLERVPVVHFGDLDPNGIRIYKHLRTMRPDLRWSCPRTGMSWSTREVSLACGPRSSTSATHPSSCSASLAAVSGSSKSRSRSTQERRPRSNPC